MKKIALLIHDLDSEYSRSMIDGVYNYCKDNDISAYIFPARSKNYPHLEYDYQNFIISNLINKNNFDGAVIATATQSHYITQQELLDFMYSFSPMPIVSIGYEIPKIPSVVVDCNSGIWEEVDHIVKKHGRKKIAFFTSLGGNPEANERTKAFKKAMEDHNLEVNNDYFFDCDFTYWSSYAKMEEYYKKHSCIDFDAAVAINDDMAFGIIDFCKKYSIRIPEDLIVTGFDDSKKASIVPPLLSSINQQIETQGAYACEVLSKMIDGIEVDYKHTIQTKPKFRQTCGCINLHDNKIQYVNYEGKTIINKEATEKLSSEWYYIKSQLTDVTLYSQSMQSDITIKDLAKRLNEDLSKFQISGYAICLYSQPFDTEKGRDLYLPDSAFVLSAFDKEFNYETNFSERKIKFNPNVEMIPSGILKNLPGKIIIHPLFQRNTQLGYFIFRPGNYETSMYELLNSTICSIIMNSLIYTKSLEEKAEMEENNKKLSQMSRTDELTQILNRRGFYALAQQTLSIAIDMQQTGLVIYGDMDGLKKINDTYGHDAGDRAIQAESKILRSTFRSSDVIGRMGGDEFAIVTVGLDPKTFKKSEQKIEKACAEWNKTSNEPFELSISLGYAQFDSMNYCLPDLIKEADAMQYEVKRAKKMERK